MAKVNEYIYEPLDARVIEGKTNSYVKPFDRRIAIVDFLRGFFLIMVFFEHFVYDLHDYLPRYFTALGISSGGFYEFANYWICGKAMYFKNAFRIQFRDFALNSFVLLSGISCAFSKNNWVRAAKMLLLFFIIQFLSNLAAGLDSIYHIYNAPLAINFNVIGVIALSLLIYCFVQNKSLPTLIIFTIIYLIIGIFAIPPLAELLKDSNSIFYPLWRPATEELNGIRYYQVDYMALFPFSISFFVGAIIAKTYYAHPEKHLKYNQNWMKPVCFIGRHSLIFYITHNFVFLAIIIGVLKMIGG